MFYSPSQERAQYFPRQEGVTIIFPNKHVFAYQKKRGLEFPLSARRGRQEFFPGMTFLSGQKKKPMISCTQRKMKESSPEKQKRQILNKIP